MEEKGANREPNEAKGDKTESKSDQNAPKNQCPHQIAKRVRKSIKSGKISSTNPLKIDVEKRVKKDAKIIEK